MKKIISYISLSAAGILFAISLILPNGCANTTAAPAGGPKDTIPPLLTATIPDVYQINVPVSLKKIELQFNEYVKIVDATKNIILSRRKKSYHTQLRAKGRSRPEKELNPIQRTAWFRECHPDNNEGNPFPILALAYRG